jgi:hypothetical protein
MEKLHRHTKSSKNFVWEGKILTFGTSTKVLEYFENGSVKKYKSGNIKKLEIFMKMEVFNEYLVGS